MTMMMTMMIMTTTGKTSVKDGMSKEKSPSVVAVPFLRDSDYINSKSDNTESGTFMPDARRLAKRVALSSPGSVPMEYPSHNSNPNPSNTTGDTFPVAISEYRWGCGLWSVRPPPSTGALLWFNPCPAARSPSSTDDISSQQRLSALPLSVLSALRLGWLEARNKPPEAQEEGGEAHLDLKVGHALIVITVPRAKECSCAWYHDKGHCIS